MNVNRRETLKAVVGATIATMTANAVAGKVLGDELFEPGITQLCSQVEPKDGGFIIKNWIWRNDAWSIYSTELISPEGIENKIKHSTVGLLAASKEVFG